jgi:hypothetical protein
VTPTERTMPVGRGPSPELLQQLTLTSFLSAHPVQG